MQKPHGSFVLVGTRVRGVGLPDTEGAVPGRRG